MKKRAEQKGSSSPYVKYQKAPYAYSFKACGHKNTNYQSMPTWKGKVCTACNIIVESFERDNRPSR